MAISATSSRYDAILLHRQKQAAAAELREARSIARQQMAQDTLAKSEQLRFSVTNAVAQSAADQSQLMAQIIRSRVQAQAAEKAAPAKWYRSA
jgi:hypothetical protein